MTHLGQRSQLLCSNVDMPKGTSKNLLLGHLVHLRVTPCTSKAVFLGAIFATLATVFRGPQSSDWQKCIVSANPSQNKH